MSTSATSADLPDVMVHAIRRAGKEFMTLQAARYPAASASTSSALVANEAATTSLVMRTKSPVPQRGGSARGAEHIPPSTWSEVYRGAVQDLPDAPSHRLWDLVSTVLSLLEQGGTADGVNASAAIVSWGHRSSSQLQEVEALLGKLQQSHPRRMSDDAMEDIGSAALGCIDHVFLAGHFEAAAALLDALVAFLRRGQSSLLSAEVEMALADVKRLLATAFHDADTHERGWIGGANAHLTEWRNTLVNPAGRRDGGSGNNSSGILSAVDALVCDTCALCKDMLLLITQDAELLVERCLEARLSGAEFLVAVCAIMSPFAELSEVASIFATYVHRWTESDEEDAWYCRSIAATLEAATLPDMVGAMATVAELVAPHRDGEELTADAVQRAQAGEDDDDEDSDSDADDAASDTVSLSEVVAHATQATPTRARCFIVACMTAHVADLCAPVGAASSAAEMSLTFTRNNLVSAYAELFAFNARTWRVAALYACYSPLVNPRFIADIVEAAAVHASFDESVHQSLHAFFQTSWSSHSALQMAVRARLETVLPGSATVAKWWAAVDFTYAAAYRKVHRYLIATLWGRQQWARAASLGMETGLTDTLQFHLRQILRGPHALTSAGLFAVGGAVHHGFIGVDRCPTPELTRYVCAAAAVAAYRLAATNAEAAATHFAHAQASGAAAPSIDAVVRAEATCLRSVEAALTCADACDVTWHPSTTLALVEHGASLVLSLRQRMRDPITGDSTGSMHVSSSVLPLLVEAYQLASIHFAPTDVALTVRSRKLAEKLSQVHQTCI